MTLRIFRGKFAAVPTALVAASLFAAAQQPPDIDANERAAIATEREALKAAAVKQPESISVHSRLGDAHLFLHEFLESVAAFEKMIALDPRQDAPHWRLGIAYHFAGEFEKSSRQFAKYHAYDGRDRENGIWKFLADARLHGVEKARSMMLEYTQFDREPFPALYEMFAGKKTSADVVKHVEEKKLVDQPQVVFFAHYYAGLNEDLLGNRPAAIEHLRKAVALFTPQTAARLADLRTPSGRRECLSGLQRSGVLRRLRRSAADGSSAAGRDLPALFRTRTRRRENLRLLGTQL